MTIAPSWSTAYRAPRSFSPFASITNMSGIDLLKETGERVMACAREILQQLEAGDHAIAS